MSILVMLLFVMYACCSALKAKLITPLGVMEAAFVRNGYTLTGYMPPETLQPCGRLAAAHVYC